MILGKKFKNSNIHFSAATRISAHYHLFSLMPGIISESMKISKEILKLNIFLGGWIDFLNDIVHPI
jgi:uncharacterized protein YqiB (DUF1249 family)